MRNLLMNLRIGTLIRLGINAVQTLMALMIAVALWRFAGVGDSVDRMIGKDVAQLRAIDAAQALMLDNARRTTEMLLTSDASQLTRAHAAIESNRQSIGKALDSLEKSMDSAKDKAALGQIREARERFIQACTGVEALVQQGKRDEAAKLLTGEVFPAIEALRSQAVALQGGLDSELQASAVGVRAQVDGTTRLLIGMCVASLILGAVFAWWLTRTITTPIARAVEVARTVASGDLTSSIDVRGRNESAQMLQALKDMNQSLVRVVSDVRHSSDAIAAGSAEIAAGSTDLSHRTEDQAGDLERTAASMEELTVTVKQNADTARQASDLARSASAAASHGGEVVGKVVHTMQAISESSRRISDIIGVIDAIAFQTNILALNAAVEAARAGEQGRGFAVVASEVRALAQRSADAAREIKQLISESVQTVESGAQQVGAAGRSMEDIVTQVRRVTDLIGEISAAGVEQAQGLGQIGDAVNHLDEATQSNAALVEQSTAAADSLSRQATRLAELVSVFKTPASDMAETQARKAIAPVVERRGPNRATNVSRPDFAGSRDRSATTVPSPARHEHAAATGTDGWSSF